MTLLSCSSPPRPSSSSSSAAAPPPSTPTSPPTSPCESGGGKKQLHRQALLRRPALQDSTFRILRSTPICDGGRARFSTTLSDAARLLSAVLLSDVCCGTSFHGAQQVDRVSGKDGLEKPLTPRPNEIGAIMQRVAKEYFLEKWACLLRTCARGQLTTITNALRRDVVSQLVPTESSSATLAFIFELETTLLKRLAGGGQLHVLPRGAPQKRSAHRCLVCGQGISANEQGAIDSEENSSTNLDISIFPEKGSLTLFAEGVARLRRSRNPIACNDDRTHKSSANTRLSIALARYAKHIIRTSKRAAFLASLLASRESHRCDNDASTDTQLSSLSSAPTLLEALAIHTGALMTLQGSMPAVCKMQTFWMEVAITGAVRHSQLKSQSPASLAASASDVVDRLLIDVAICMSSSYCSAPTPQSAETRAKDQDCNSTNGNDDDDNDDDDDDDDCIVNSKASSMMPCFGGGIAFEEENLRALFTRRAILLCVQLLLRGRGNSSDSDKDKLTSVLEQVQSWAHILEFFEDDDQDMIMLCMLSLQLAQHTENDPHTNTSSRSRSRDVRSSCPIFCPVTMHYWLLVAAGVEPRKASTPECCLGSSSMHPSPPSQAHEQSVEPVEEPDITLLLDWLVCGETAYLEYLVSFLRYLQSAAHHAEQHFSACTLLPRIFAVLACLHRRLTEYEGKRLLPFSAKPLLRRLASVLSRRAAEAGDVPL